MNDLIEHILNGDFDSANQLVEKEMVQKLRTTLHASKKKLAAKKFTRDLNVRSMEEKLEVGDDTKEAKSDEKNISEISHDERIRRLRMDVLESEDNISEARINIVKARIRGGKVQRRKKVSNVPGMTIRDGKLTRMSPAERRRRKMGARKAKIKARAKKSQALRKRKLSLMKRKRLGI